MAISAKYNALEVEPKWYKFWMENGFFSSKPNEKESYTIVIPPPNVTGVLHMGHMLNNTIQDVLIRRARMLGYNACWVPGTDHASIATEAKVVNKLKEEGIDKKDIGREKFLDHAWDWTHKHGGIILEQLKRLGASCDWDRTKFTMEDDMSESVINVFVDLYEKGMIYRGSRIVNWDPKALTAVSDEEVIHKEVNSKLYYVKYQIENSDEFITIATTRPETIMGDTAVCVHPDDERYKHLKGKRVIIPLVNRSVPIINDTYIDLEFGTGALKVTPAHDINDYEIGLRHNLEVIDTLNPDGTLSDAAQILVGVGRFKARREMGKLLEESGNLVKIEEYKNKVGTSERTGEVIEPRLSLQWFLNMDKIAEPALKAVLDDEIKLIPKKFENTYKHWMENIRDWCISRQLCWGHQIPAYYYGNGKDDFVVANNIDKALVKAREITKNQSLQASDLKQDADVMDTWFSSWLWPISVFDGINNPNNEEINYYYPTKALVTAPEILFFWVARMAMAGYEYVGKKPFDDVYLTGIVRDKQGRKMSKSLGNSPDPIELIEKYTADGVRVGMLLSSPAGNDLLFDEKLCEQGRNFGNKIWNAFRLTQGWEIIEMETPQENLDAIAWIKARISEALVEMNDHYSKYRMSDALMTTYKLIWDDFCSWYLESIKPEYQKPIDKKTFEATQDIFEDLLKIVHPFMPFLSEEIWQTMKPRKIDESLIAASWPKENQENSSLIKDFSFCMQTVSEVRNIRNAKNLSPKEQLELKTLSNLEDIKFKEVIAKLSGLKSINTVTERPENANSFIVNGSEFFIPLEELVNPEEELKKLQAELEYTQGFLNSVAKKLSNERFVNNAPAQVVESENKKKADAESKIETLKNQIASLS